MKTVECIRHFQPCFFQRILRKGNNYITYIINSESVILIYHVLAEISLQY